MGWYVHSDLYIETDRVAPPSSARKHVQVVAKSVLFLYFHELAMHFASIVLPVPGGPKSSTW